MFQTQTYLPWPGGSHLFLFRQLCTFSEKSSKNVNKFSVFANLVYYLRTATEKISLVDKCLFLDRIKYKAKALCGGGKFWFDVRLRNMWRNVFFIIIIFNLGITLKLYFHFSLFWIVCCLRLTLKNQTKCKKLQKTIVCLHFPSSQPYLEGIERKWSLSCSQETRKVTVCQHHLMSVILLVSSGRSQTHVPRGQSVIQTADSNTTQASGQKTAVSTSQPNHLTDYTDLVVLETGWVDFKRWCSIRLSLPLPGFHQDKIN